MESLQIATCLISSISLLLLIIALASDYWIVALDKQFHAGLWRACINHNCMSLGMKRLAVIHATRAFMLMGTIAGAVSFFGFCASFFLTHIGSISIKRFAMVTSFWAGVCSMIAMSIFTGASSDITSIIGEISFVWSFAIGWASFPLFLITGGLAYKMISRTTQRRAPTL